MASCLTTPMDVVKTRMQVEMGRGIICEAEAKKGRVETPRACATADVVKEVYRREGVAGFWRGNVARCTRVGPACAVMLGSFEMGKRVLGGD